MRHVAVLWLTLVAAVALGAEQKYSSKYDNIDLDGILSNERLYKQYFNCLINKGKCTPDAKLLKDNLPDALRSACSRCTQKQKNGMFRAMKFMIQKKRNDFNKLSAIYDPQGIYRKKFAAEARKHGINL